MGVKAFISVKIPGCGMSHDDMPCHLAHSRPPSALPLPLFTRSWITGDDGRGHRTRLRLARDPQSTELMTILRSPAPPGRRTCVYLSFRGGGRAEFLRERYALVPVEETPEADDEMEVEFHYRDALSLKHVTTIILDDARVPVSLVFPDPVLHSVKWMLELVAAIQAQAPSPHANLSARCQDH
jgi:hypothetical protein